MLRSLFVLSAIVFGAAQSLRGPFYALLFYLWLAYFRPETWVWWDFVSQLNMSLIMGVFVLGSTPLATERGRLGLGAMLALAFLAQSTLSTMTSETFDYAWAYWQDFVKSTLISVIIVTLVTTEQKLRLMLIIIGLSLGMEAAKQGWVQMVINPGGINLNEHPVLGDNNGVAVGMLMLAPLLLALGRTANGRREQLFFRFMAVGVLYRAVSTYSRGGFLACTALGLHYLARSKRKMSAGLAIGLVVVLIVPILPQQFWDRMSTINDATEDPDNADGSVRGRLHFWQVAFAMANDKPLTGVGHNAYPVNYNKYDFSFGEFGRSRAVHSSWMAVFSELGYPGLALYLTIIAYALWVCRRARLGATRYPEMEHIGIFATAIEAALVAWMVGATFVTFQYTELLWHTFAFTAVVDNLVKQRIADLAAKAAPASAPAPSLAALIAARARAMPRGAA